MNRASILIVLVTAFLSGCYYDVESELYPVCEVPETVLYSIDVQPIIANNCAISGCHVAGGSGSGNFSNYNPLKIKVDNGTFQNEALIDQTMPPNASLSPCDIQILQKWVDDGAPNN